MFQVNARCQTNLGNICAQKRTPSRQGRSEAECKSKSTSCDMQCKNRFFYEKSECDHLECLSSRIKINNRITLILRRSDHPSKAMRRTTVRARVKQHQPISISRN